MFGRKKDFMKGLGMELIAAYSAATNHEERDAVVKKYATKCGHSTNGVRGYLVKQNAYIPRHINHVERTASPGINNHMQYDNVTKDNPSVSNFDKVQDMGGDLATSLVNIYDYTVVTGKTNIELVQNVKEKMQDGWQPFGAVGISDFGVSHIDGNQYIQAMVKYRSRYP